VTPRMESTESKGREAESTGADVEGSRGGGDKVDGEESIQDGCVRRPQVITENEVLPRRMRLLLSSF